MDHPSGAIAGLRHPVTSYNDKTKVYSSADLEYIIYDAQIGNDKVKLRAIIKRGSYKIIFEPIPKIMFNINSRLIIPETNMIIRFK